MIRFFMYIFFIVLVAFSSLAQIQSEEIVINNDKVELPGTLTYPSSKAPLLIWIHGSGGVNRDGNQPQYIKQFRDTITKNNIAFFSYDKRTANPKNATVLKEKGVLISDFVNDAKAVVNHFKNDKRFNEIILIGHSQGSLIAMLASQNVDKYISLAGAGETIDKTLVRQISNQNPFYGALTEKYLKELKETGTIKEVDPNLLSLFAKPNQPFLSSWIALNPTAEIKKVKIPTLIVNGDKDLQVPVTDAKNLYQVKPDAQFVIINNMNHILKDIQKDEDNMKSYFNPDFSISSELIEIVTNFILTSKS